MSNISLPRFAPHRPAYVQSDITDAEFFASPCRFGPDGVEEVLGYGEISDYEQGWFDKMVR